MSNVSGLVPWHPLDIFARQPPSVVPAFFKGLDGYIDVRTACDPCSELLSGSADLCDSAEEPPTSPAHAEHHGHGPAHQRKDDLPQAQAADTAPPGRAAGSSVSLERAARLMESMEAISTGNISDETVQALQEAVQLEGEGDACGSSLPWLNLSDEAFCSILLALLPQDQAYRVTCAAMHVLRLKLGSLTVPATQRLASTVALIGGRHPVPLAQMVLGELLAAAQLNAAQAELIARSLKESDSPDLAAGTFSAAAEAEGWGMSWNESTIAVLAQILKLQPAISEVHLRKHVMALCMAARQPSLVKSIKYAKLLLTFTTAYPAPCRLFHGQLMEAASMGRSMLAKTCMQKVSSLVM